MRKTIANPLEDVIPENPLNDKRKKSTSKSNSNRSTNRRKSRKKPLTENQKAFKQQQTRIKRYIAKKAKEGYKISGDFKVPDMPKRVTKKAIEDIKSITWRTLLKQMEKTPQQPKKPVMSKADEAWIKIQHFMEEVRILPTRHQQKVADLIQEYISKFDEEEVAAAIDQMPRSVREFVSKYGSEFDYEGFNATFLQYIPGVSKGIQNELEDIIEQLQTGEYYAGA